MAKIFAVGGDRVNTSPQIAMMNTLFLREHNRLAELIEQANPLWDDDRVFETARNTVIVLFIKIVVEEYINHISPAPFRFRAEPEVAWNAPWNKPNWIAIEFSLLYRWHSLIPDTIMWSGATYPAGDTFFHNQILLDTGLATAFADMSSQRAGELGAFNTTAALLPIELLAIQMGRMARLASYSNYCEYVDLPRPQRFSDITENLNVVNFLRANYQSVEDVEFYIGLFAEEAVKNSPLPSLMLRMVAVDAFSQALTNPLLSEHVYKEETFTDIGWAAIKQTNTLEDVLMRNTPNGTGGRFVGMTAQGWKYSWP